MADEVTITLGKPGHSDRFLAELRAAALQMNMPLESALALVCGFGLAYMRREGMIGERALQPMTRQEILATLPALYENAPDEHDE